MFNSSPTENIVRVVYQVEEEQEMKKVVIKHLNLLADKFDLQQHRMNKAKVAFASSGIIGTGLVIGGIAAAPFTFGASLGLTIAGTVVGVSSGVGGTATFIADKFTDSDTMKDAKDKVEKYNVLIKKLQEGFDKIQKLDTKELELLRKEKPHTQLSAAQSQLYDRILGSQPLPLGTNSGFTDGSSDGAAAGAAGAAGAAVAVASTPFVRTGVAVGSDVAKVVTKGLKVLRIGGIVVCALTVPLDIYTIVDNSIKIHKKTPSKTAKEIRRCADYLQSIETQQKQERALWEMCEKAAKNDCTIWSMSKLKLMFLVFQVCGTLLITMGAVQAIHIFSFEYLIRYGMVLVILSGIGGFCFEMYVQMECTMIWTSAEKVFDGIMIKDFSDLDENEIDVYHSVRKLYDTFKWKVESGKFPLVDIRDFILIAIKLVLDVFAVEIALRTYNPLTVAEEVSSAMISLDGALRVGNPVIQPEEENTLVAGAIIYIFTFPLCMYTLFATVTGMFVKKKSKFMEAVDQLVEDIRKVIRK